MNAKPSLGPPIVLAVAAVALGAFVGGASARGHAARLSFRLDHYLCYSIKPSSAVQRKTVVVVDQFRKGWKATTVRPELLCNPTSKNGGKVANRRAHLLCYVTRVSGSYTPRRVVVANQFGRVRLEVARPNSLCLPSAKRIQPAVTTGIPKGLDHFQCYPVKPLTQSKKQTVSLRDQFGTGRYVVATPIRLCNPASKNKSTVLNKRDHLLCYVIDPRQQVASKDVFVLNQFGRLLGSTVAPRQLCVPSLKRTLSA